MKKVFQIKVEWYEVLEDFSNEQRGEILNALFLFNLGRQSEITISDKQASLFWKSILKTLPKVKENIKSVNEPKAYSKESEDFVNWLTSDIMKHSKYVTRAINNQKTKEGFQELYTQLRKDYSKSEIAKAIQFAVNDIFWRDNFLSPLKLNQTSKKLGMKYIDVFLSRIEIPKMDKEKQNKDRFVDSKEVSSLGFN